MRMQLIGNRYRIKGLIGEGGMASVYSALDEKLDRRIAIKILHPHLSRNQDIRKRFHQEARSISGIDHPNIIKIYDFSGVDSGQLWIVTEILYGVDLAEYVQRFPKNRIHPLVATLITREICKALAEAHRHGIVHRDIKPENIMVLDSGRIKLMDFGIAKVAQNPSATQTGTFMGSPSYMSPEQIRGTKIDARTDIYSLCVLFYEIIAGILPFIGNTTPDVINKIIIGKFSPPIAINPLLPHVLNNLIIKGLQNKREDRYSEINHLASDLDQFLINCEMAESHVELERFFRSPKEFEKKLAEFNKNNQIKPKMLKITDSPSEAGANSSQSAQETRMTSSDEQTQRVKQQQNLQPKGSQPMPIHTLVSAHGGSSNLKQQQAQASHRLSPQGRGRIVTKARNRQRGPKPAQLTIRSTKHTQSNDFFWTTILVASIALAAFLGGMIFFDGFKYINNADQVRQEMSRQKQAWQRSRMPSNQSNNQTRRSEGENVASSSRTASNPVSTPAEDSRNRTRPSEITTRMESSPATAKDERLPTSVSRRPISTPQPQQRPAPNRTTTVSRSQPEGAKMASSEPNNSQPSMPASSTVAPTEPSAPLAVLKPSPGTIHVRSFPVAEIFIDDQARGTTNDRRIQQRGISVSPGKYRISLRRSGFESAEEVLDIKDNEVLKLNYVLSRKQVFIPLTVQSNRIPALVYIEQLKSDGRKNQITLTDTSFELQLEPGSYRIEVVYSGQRIERNIEIKENSDAFTFNANFD